MTAPDNPLEAAVEQAMDTFVFAPIGLLFDGPANYDELVTKGKNQVNTARMMGQFTVQMGRTELEKRTRALDGPLADVLRGLGVIEPPVPTPRPTPTVSAAPADKPAPAKKAAAAKKARKKATAKKARKKATAKKNTAARRVQVPGVGSLPIPDYDSLSASQVVTRLQGLATQDLEAIRAYEAAKRARKTILGKISQLQK